MSTDSVNPEQTNNCSQSSLSSEKKTFHKAAQSCKSMESVYSHSAASSSKQSGCSLNMYKRKPHRTTGSAAPVSEVRQRVVSARMHRIRNVQNQLSDAQLHISELISENRLLRTLHKRQDVALSKYESTNSDLPQLLHAHAEEIRMWQARVRNLQTQNKDLAQKLKQKDTVMQGLSDQNRHFQQLNNDRNLDEREKLSERVAFLEMRLQEKDEEMKVSARRTQLEAKSLKSQLLTEQSKLKEILHKLDSNESVENTSFKSSRSSLPISRVKQLTNSIRPSMTKLIKPATFPKHVASEMHKDSNATSSSTDSQDNTSFLRKPKLTVSNDVTVSNVQLKASSSNNPGDLTTKIRYGMGDLKLSDQKSANTSEETVTEDEYNTDVEKQCGVEKSSNSDNGEPDWDDDVSEEEEEEEDEGELENYEEDKDIVVHDEEETETDMSDVESSRSSEQQQNQPEAVSSIEAIRKNNRIDIVRRETYLETLCESLETDAKLGDLDLSSGDGPNKHSSSTLSTQRSTSFPTAETRATGIPRRKTIDPKKKTQLLHALRVLDSN